MKSVAAGAIRVRIGTNDSTIQRFNDSTIQRFNDSTIQRFNDSTIQRFNDSTIQRFNDSTIQRFNDSTIQRAILRGCPLASDSSTSLRMPIASAASAREMFNGGNSRITTGNAGTASSPFS